MHDVDNPYAPPKSDVAVPIPRAAAAARPSPVTRAVRLLYLSLPLMVLSTAYDYEGLPGEAVFYAVATLLLAWLYSRIGRGRNWARITFLVLTLISVPAMVEHYPELRADAVWHLVLDLTVLAMEFAAAYLLLTRPAASWFRGAA
jgi:hypothetical protein